MKKFILVYFSLLVATQITFSYANLKNVAPEVTVQGQIDNQTIFLWQRDLIFTSYDQDVYAYTNAFFTKQGPFFIELPEGTSGTFYIDYFDQLNPNVVEHECKFDVTADNSGNVIVQESPVDNAFLSCSLTGIPTNNNLIMHINMNPNYSKK